MRQMRRISAITPGLIFLLPLMLVGAEPASRDALLKQYCVQCHNSKLKSGGIVLEGISAADASAHPDVSEKVVRKLRAGEMPPPKNLGIFWTKG